MAISRFGLGTGLAYTSDLSERWGGEWLAWGDCGKFWAQVLRATIRKNNSEGITMIGATVADNWLLDIRSQTSSGLPQSLLDWELTLTDEQGKSTAIEVAEVGLGKYTASIPLQSRRDFTIQLRDPASDRIRTAHFDQPYPREYNLSRVLPESVNQLDSIEPDMIRDNLVAKRNRRSIVHWFYLGALGCLLLGNFLRRI